MNIDFFMLSLTAGEIFSYICVEIGMVCDDFSDTAIFAVSTPKFTKNLK